MNTSTVSVAKTRHPKHKDPRHVVIASRDAWIGPVIGMEQCEDGPIRTSAPMLDVQLGDCLAEAHGKVSIGRICIYIYFMGFP